MKRLVLAMAIGALVVGTASSDLFAQNKHPEVKICTGGKNGNYYPAGKDIAEQLKGSKINFEVEETGGSIDNLNRLGKGCQYAIVQMDSISEWESRGNSIADIEEVDRLYKETFHLVVNIKEAPNVKQNFFNIKDSSVKIMRDGADSGTAATWETLKRAQIAKMGKDGAPMAKIPTVPEGGNAAIGKVRSGKDAQGMLFMTGVGSVLMKTVDRRARGDDGKHLLCLVSFGSTRTFGYDAAWTLVKNASGKNIYEEAVIPKGTYQNLACDAGDITTFSTAAIVVVDKEWKLKNAGLADSIAGAIGEAIPNINKRMLEANKKAQ